ENSLDALTDKTRTELAWLRREGFRIAVDDFGSGYSSMNALTEFSFDIVKVDRSLIRDNPGSARTIVVSHLIDMFRALKVDVVLEGDETEQTVRWLAGCPDLNAQGFYFGRPMWPEDVVRRLEQHGDAALAASPGRSARPVPE
ncbi:EAL domain-containing protein, partial [Arthrobacter deserti]|nr:EAL domain-containing protein [Arthrobacter deserti]